MEKIPLLAADLIRQLDIIYPEKCPSLTQTEREIFWYSGARELVRNLNARLTQEEQEKPTAGDGDVY